MSKRPKTAPTPLASLPSLNLRYDGYRNAVTGVGQAFKDKRRGAQLTAHDFAFADLEEIWRGDDMAARIVELPVDEMLRNGFDIKIEDDAQSAMKSKDAKSKGANPDQKTDADAPFAQPKPGAPIIPTLPQKPPGVIEPRGSETRAQSRALRAKFEDIRGPEMFQTAGHYERAFGGGAIIIGADDGQKDLTRPLNEKNIKSIKWLNVLTPRELWATGYYADPFAPNFGMPEIYQVQADVISPDVADPRKKPFNPTKTFVKIHESRCIIFPGTAVTKRHRQRKKGWGDSIFVRVFEALADFQGSYAGAAHLVADFAQAVFKMAGLFDALIAGNDDVIVKRARMIDESRSVARAVLLDASEEFERKSTPVTGLPELLVKFEHRLAAAAGMPVALLMGMSPGGLGSNGDSEVRFFYDRIKADQNRMLKPRLERLLRLLMLAQDSPTSSVEPDNWCVEFNPLWQLSDKEQADMRWVQAQADEKYIVNSVVTPEEVAASRFGGATWSPETVIDLESRKKLATEYDDAKSKAEDAHAKAAIAVAKAPPAPPAK